MRPSRPTGALGGGRLPAVLLSVALAGAALVAAPAPARATTERYSFAPVADTYVDSSAPATSYATNTNLTVKGGGVVRQSLLRFDVSGVVGTVTSVRLELWNRNGSPQGGRVFKLEDNSWPETVTWTDRPVFDDGDLLDSFGAVTANQSYAAQLGPVVVGDGLLSLALSSPNSDAAQWASRESSLPDPRLVVVVEQEPGFVMDGVSQVAGQADGSSEPTYFPTNHRTAVTASGRVLAVHGRHRTGVQLTWRNPGGAWRTDTNGAVSDGVVLRNTGTGDWPASVVIAEEEGVEHAWVVWGGPGPKSARQIEMRHLGDLDAAGGPTVGPPVSVAPPGVVDQTGNSKPDIAFETASDGSVSGVVSWLERIDSTHWGIAYRWFEDVAVNQPALQTKGYIFPLSTNASRFGTLEPTPTGVAWVGRGPNNNLRVYTHASGADPDAWNAGVSTGTALSSMSYPSAVVLDSGQILAVAETSTTSHTVKLQRFTSTGAVAGTEAQLTGYRHPTIASDGLNAWIVATTVDGTKVISRSLTDSGWGPEVVEMDSSDSSSGNYAYANAAREVDGRLRFIVRGPSGGPAQNGVLACQRPIAGPGCTEI